MIDNDSIKRAIELLEGKSYIEEVDAALNYLRKAELAEQHNTELLDHGYVKLIDFMGSDEGIVEAARMSTGKSFQGWEKDEGFLRRLWLGAKDEGQALPPMPKHSSPFEHAEIAIEVCAPIFVFREWHRHRTQSYNEMSARYTQLPDLQYIPSSDRLMSAVQSSKNKQGSQEGFTREQAAELQQKLRESYDITRLEYEHLLEMGVARGVARLVVPVAQYSIMRAKSNLLNWLRFLTLRMAHEAQWEIRQYANVVGEIVKTLHPRTWDLFIEGMSNIQFHRGE